MLPVDGQITQVFGANPQFAWQLGYGHLGIDIGGPEGKPIYAIADGVVTFADWSQKMSAAQCAFYMFIYGSPNSGIVITIEHDGWHSVDAHMSRTDLNPGQRVKRGDIIGYVGSTGNSTGNHVHYEVTLVPAPATPRFGRYNPMLQIEHEDKVAAPLIPTPTRLSERIAGPAGGNRRSAPVLGNNVVGSFAGNSVENFTGYVIGPEVDLGGVKSNIWYVDHGDNGKGAARYHWAGLFTEQKISGLPNLTPAPKNRRKMGPAGGIQRTGAYSKAPIVRLIPAGQNEDFTHWVKGQSVDGNNIWYADSLGLVWSGVFETQETTGLTERPLTAAEREPVVIAPPQTGGPGTPPEDKPYTFTKSVSCVTEVLPAAEGKFQRGGMPNVLTGAVLHQFIAGPTRADVHLNSVISTFTENHATDNRIASAHFGVEGKRIVQFVDIKDRAYHAGADGNGHIGIEIYGGMDVETIASVVLLLQQLEKLTGSRLRFFRHRDIMATQCGDNVDIDAIRGMVDLALPVPTPDVPNPPPVVTPTPAPQKNEAEVLANFFAWLTQGFLSRKK